MKSQLLHRLQFNKRFGRILITFIVLSAFGIVSYLLGRFTKTQSDFTIFPLQSEKVLVTFVVDGDTIQIEDGRRIRYIGIDAPETMHPVKGEECFGPEATIRNQELVEGKVVELVSDVEDLDKYGRYLRYVFVDGVFVNADLISGGFAYSASYGSEHKFRQVFTQLEHYSKLLKRGLWSVCY